MLIWRDEFPEESLLEVGHEPGVWQELKKSLTLGLVG